eukprot:m51a1_g3164 putative mos4-associated complex subunit 5a (364) ;mRNA; f:377699-379022
MSVSKYTPASVDQRGWERSDFPIICEACLGPNPYIRMTKSEYDAECKMCTRPFTVFRWKPARDARFKQTEICQTCAKLRNVCQVCLLDLEYGLPTQLRDRVLSQAGIDVSEAPSGDTNREFSQDLAESRLEAGQAVAYEKLEPTTVLMKLARSTPYVKRTESTTCAFWLRGECRRGTACPFRHEAPQQPQPQQSSADAAAAPREKLYGIGEAEAALGRRPQAAGALAPPADPAVRTLYVGNLEAATTELDVRDAFERHGELEGVRLLAGKGCAFVTFARREAAEEAAAALFGKLVLRDRPVRIAWGRKLDGPQQHGARPSSSSSSVPAPPGATLAAPAGSAALLSAPAAYPSMDPRQQGAAAK